MIGSLIYLTITHPDATWDCHSLFASSRNPPWGTKLKCAKWVMGGTTDCNIFCKAREYGPARNYKSTNKVLIVKQINSGHQTSKEAAPSLRPVSSTLLFWLYLAESRFNPDSVRKLSSSHHWSIQTHCNNLGKIQSTENMMFYVQTMHIYACYHCIKEQVVDVINRCIQTTHAFR